MNIAEKSLELVREATASTEENAFMHQYADLLVEVDRMKSELLEQVGNVSQEIYDKKEKRIESLEASLISFNECFFKMMYYKQQMVTWKKKALDKELEFINFVTKGLDNKSNEQDRRQSL